jgi:DNA-directed RNA polymerase subunit RPC12/RpoP
MNKNEFTHAKLLDRFTPCPFCGIDWCTILAEESVSIQRGSKADETKWKLEGNVMLVYCVHGKCANCGRMFGIVNQTIPILYHSLKCPRCGSADHMESEIETWEYEYEYDVFKFTAIFECKECGGSARRKLAHAIKELLKAKRIKLSLSGIEIEKGT